MLPITYTMSFRKLSEKFAILLLLTAALGISADSQKLAAPRQEKLLNGLKLLMWPDNKADKISVKIRIHSGSAFDPQGKEGTMRLLADSFFPNENAREFFTDDLGGDLQVIATYDYIQVNASCRPDQDLFLTMLETLATAVSSPTIDKETTVKLRTALLAKVTEYEADPAYVADRAVASRLFGNFPYGRPLYGTKASLQRVDFADLLGAKQRFLTADNATVAISGNFDRSVAYRAARRYFGSWLKADRTVPSTFRQPDDPALAVLSLPSPRDGGAAVRFAFRGVARGDKDLAPSLVFAHVVQARLLAALKPANDAEISVRNEFRTLPGHVVITVPAKVDGKGFAFISPETREAVVNSLAAMVSAAEFDAAKAAAAAEWARRDPVTFWLDADTYKISNADADAAGIRNVTLADVNTYATGARSQPLVSVLISAQPPQKP